MAGTDFFIRPASGTSSSDWVRLSNADISVAIARRMTRTVLHGGEGDDLVDEGAESAVYTVRGEMSLDDYKKVLKMFRAGNHTSMIHLRKETSRLCSVKCLLMAQKDCINLNSSKISVEVINCAH